MALLAWKAVFAAWRDSSMNDDDDDEDDDENDDDYL